MGIKESIADKIKLLREEHKMSQEELAYNINLHPASLSKIENAKVCITLNTIEKICSLYNISIKEFFNFEKPVINNDAKSLIAEINDELKEKDIKNLNIIFTIVKALK